MSFEIILSAVIVCKIAVDVSSLDDADAVETIVASACEQWPDADTAALVPTADLERFFADKKLRLSWKDQAATASPPGAPVSSESFTAMIMSSPASIARPIAAATRARSPASGPG